MPLKTHISTESPQMAPIPSANTAAGGGREPLICRSPLLFGGEARILVNFDSDTIYFERCFTPKTFLAVRQKLWVCPLGDIVTVKRCQGRRVNCEWLQIVTKSGTALFSFTGTNFEALSQYLLQRFPQPGVSLIGLAMRGILLTFVVAPFFVIALLRIWHGCRGAWLFPVVLGLVIVSGLLRRRSSAAAKSNRDGGKSNRPDPD